MKFTVPTKVITSKTKKGIITLGGNDFLKRDNRRINDAKRAFKDYVSSLRLKDKNKGHYQNPVRLHLKYYHLTNGSFDEDNMGYGVHKFTADALVDCGLILGDDYKRVKFPSFEFMGVDTDYTYEGRPHLKGRCDVWIEELR